MKQVIENLIKAAKDFQEYQSVGNAAKLNCAIETAEKKVKLFDEPEIINKEYSSKIIDYPNLKENESDDFFIYCSCGYPLKITGSIQCGRCGGIIQDKDFK